MHINVYAYLYSMRTMACSCLIGTSNWVCQWVGEWVSPSAAPWSLFIHANWLAKVNADWSIYYYVTLWCRSGHVLQFCQTELCCASLFSRLNTTQPLIVNQYLKSLFIVYDSLIIWSLHTKCSQYIKGTQLWTFQTWF